MWGEMELYRSVPLQLRWRGMTKKGSPALHDYPGPGVQWMGGGTPGPGVAGEAKTCH